MRSLSPSCVLLGYFPQLSNKLAEDADRIARLHTSTDI